MINARLRAWLFAAAFAVTGTTAVAHGDEDHGEAAKAPARATPARAAAPGADDPSQDATPARRQPDGSLFVPKSVQRQLGLRTIAAKREALSSSVALEARVVADPNAGGRVQPSQAGRIEAGPAGLPMLGQRVAKGQVLAIVQPSIDAIERGNQKSQLASLDAQLALATNRAARLEQLDGVVPRKDVEAARIEVQSLQARRSAVDASLSAREPLRAPINGVVSVTRAVAGQLVEAREVLFEIVDPAGFMIEALAYDPAIAGTITGGSAELPGGSLELRFVGAGAQMRGQAVPVLFRPPPGRHALAIGQPLRVLARTVRRHDGIALPREALARDRSGGQIVWSHVRPEQYVARRVQVEAIDADTVAVLTGLAPGERIVVTGASLLSQVR